MFIRLVGALLLSLMSFQAMAWDAAKASRYSSPDYYRPNVDRLIVNGTGPSVQTNGDIVCQTGTCLLGNFAGANIRGTTGTTLFVRPAANVADGTQIRSAGSAAYGLLKGLEINASTLAILVTESLRITPTPGSATAMGINMVGSGPASGSTAGPFSFNKIDTSWFSKVTGDGTYGGSGSGSVSALSVSIKVGGPNFDATSVFGGSFGVNQLTADTSGADKVGLSSGAHLSASTQSKLYGGSSAVSITTGGNAPYAFGHEVDMIFDGSAVIPVASGYNSWSGGPVAASSEYSAFSASVSGAANTAGWKAALFLRAIGGNAPIQATGSLVASNYSGTIANVLNLPTMTVTGNILSFPGVVLTGSGRLTTASMQLYTSPPVVPAGQVGFGSLTVASAFCGSPAGAAGCLAINVSGTARYIPFY